MPKIARQSLLFVACCGLVTACGPSLKAKNPYERHLALQDASDGALVSAARTALADKDWRIAATVCRLGHERGIRDLAGPAAKLLAQRDFADNRSEHCVRLLGKVGDAATHSDVVAAYLKSRRAAMRMEALRALAMGRLGRPGAEAYIGDLVFDADPRIRAHALKILSGYKSPTAKILVAVGEKRWAEAIRLGGVRPMFRALHFYPAKARAEMFATALKAGGPAARKLAVKVLDDTKFTTLHIAAYEKIIGRRGHAKLRARVRERELAKWKSRLAKAEAGCSTPGWYTSFTTIKSWRASARYNFLKEAIAEVQRRCRRAALQWLKENPPKVPAKVSDAK